MKRIFGVTIFAALLVAVFLAAPCKPDPCEEYGADSCECKFAGKNFVDVTFTADLTPGLVDADCNDYDEYKWASKGVGKSMFIVGAVHHENRAAEDCMVGGQTWVSEMIGDWTPNQMKLNKTGDNVYSITLKNIPEGIHMAYKYTWGHEGDDWGDTEEFPGNQRIVEVKDNDGDKKYTRYDKFADETTNKDLVNLNTCGNGTVDWDTDVNTPAAGKACDGDGTPDTQETFKDDKGINYYYCD